MLVEIPLLDAILDTHSAALGEDFHRYRNHAYRVANFHWLLGPGAPADVEIVAVAVGFHDLGLWTANTFDYLAPSERLATDFLHARGQAHLAPLVVAMIDHHHQLSRVEAADPRIERFRQADWIDVSAGLRRFGLAADQLARVKACFPYLGFHRRLLRFALHHALRHPLDPLPMFKR